MNRFASRNPELAMQGVMAPSASAIQMGMRAAGAGEECLACRKPIAAAGHCINPRCEQSPLHDPDWDKRGVTKRGR